VPNRNFFGKLGQKLHFDPDKALGFGSARFGQAERQSQGAGHARLGVASGEINQAARFL
jgi:hypothetical protein